MDMLGRIGKFCDQTRNFVESRTIQYVAIQGDNEYTTEEATQLIGHLLEATKGLIALHTKLQASFYNDD